VNEVTAIRTYTIVVEPEDDGELVPEEVEAPQVMAISVAA
jgi:hypothetical protein